MHKFSSLTDNGVPFEIVPNTRKITVPQKHRVIGTVGDHLSEQVTFICPTVIDGHDITLCGRKYVSWRNVIGDQGNDELNELSQENGEVLFSWNVPEGVTIGKGVVSFSVHFEDVDDKGKVTYRWGTSACSDCEILDAINTALGTYKSMYVSDNTLVIADYTPVQDRTLEIGSESIIPDGSMQIISNGKHDVRQYAEVDVDVPCDHDLTNLTPENVKKDVTINNVTGTFEGDHDLTNLKPENVKKGVNIDGVMGTFDGDFSNFTLQIKNSSSYGIWVTYSKFTENGALEVYSHEKVSIGISHFEVARGGFVIVHAEEHTITASLEDTGYTGVEGEICYISPITNAVFAQPFGNSKRIVIKNRMV